MKLFSLLTEVTEHPFTGTGKPEPLKHQLADYWSRRINRGHQLVYVVDDVVVIHSTKGHYY